MNFGLSFGFGKQTKGGLASILELETWVNENGKAWVTEESTKKEVVSWSAVKPKSKQG